MSQLVDQIRSADDNQLPELFVAILDRLELNSVQMGRACEKAKLTNSDALDDIWEFVCDEKNDIIAPY